VADPAPLHAALSLPRDSYPRDALVRVGVQIENRSGEPVEMAEIGRHNPIVQVHRPDGSIATNSYEPRLAGHSGGPTPGPISLAPGQSIGAHQYVMLRDSWVDVAIRSSAEVDTDRLDISLLEPDPPAVTMHTTAPVYADIEPMGPVEGPLLAQYVFTRDNGHFSGTTTWLTIDGTRLEATYDEASPWDFDWRFVVAWEGHSVAEGIYRQQR
jgi:hypothetical protein